MKYLIKKDKKNRFFFFKQELNWVIFKNIIKNKVFPVELRWRGFLFFTKTARSNTIFVNRCLITGRKKRLNRFYNFSRINFLKLARSGFLSGLSKTSW